MIIKQRNGHQGTLPAVDETPFGLQGRLAPAREAAPAGPPAAPPGPDGRSVLIRHGIHRGTYPVVGMTVAMARATLAPLLNIDPAAVAVLGGQPVLDEAGRVLTEADRTLSFVKMSSLKGRT